MLTGSSFAYLTPHYERDGVWAHPAGPKQHKWTGDPELVNACGLQVTAQHPFNQHHSQSIGSLLARQVFY